MADEDADFIAAARAARAARDTTAAPGPTAPSPPPARRAPPPADTSLGATVGRALPNAMAFGLGERLGAALDTGISKVPGLRSGAEYLNASLGGHPGLSPLDDPSLTFDDRLREYRARDDAQDAANPVGSALATGTGSGMPMGFAAKAADIVGSGASLGRAALQGAKTNAPIGAAIGLGESRAEDLPGIAKDVGTGAVVAAGLGASAEPVAGILTRRAAAREAKAIIRDIESSADATARPKARAAIQRDENDIIAVVLADPEVAAATRRGTPASKGLPVINDKIKQVIEPRGELYSKVDDVLRGEKLPRAQSDAAGFEKAAAEVEAKATALENQIARATKTAERKAKTGTPTNPELAARASAGDASREVARVTMEEEAKALRSQALSLRDRAKTTVNDAALSHGVDPMPLVTSMRAQAKAFGTEPGVVDRATAKAFADEADSIEKTWGKAGTAPMVKLRDYATQLQERAVEGIDNVGTAHKVNAAVEDHVVDFLNGHLDRAAKASPEARATVGQIRAMNTKYSALRNIQGGLKSKALNEGKPHMFADAAKLGLQAGAGMAGFAGGGGVAGGLAAAATARYGPEVALRGAGMANRALAQLIRAASMPGPKGGLAALSQQAIEAGVPRATIQAIVRASTGYGGQTDYTAEVAP